MNNYDSNSGGWKSSYMRSSVMNTMKGYLPTDIKNIMKAVNIKTSAGSSSTTINTTSDYCFLLSQVEIFGDYGYTYSGEGDQLDYYKNESNRIKQVNGSNAIWWSRSPFKGTSTTFFYVSSTGGRGNTSSFGSASNQGVSFCFCI